MNESNDQAHTSNNNQILFGVLACAVAILVMASVIVWHWTR
jgi:hypothetical protein